MDKRGVSDSRIVWIDWAKTILIYLMVVGHCLPVQWQRTLIYAFHMPAFFIISGYLYHQNHWWKTVRSLVIPVFLFSLINFIVIVSFQKIKGTFSSDHLLERVLIPFWGPGKLPVEDYITLFPGVWFIIALFLGRLLLGDLFVRSWFTKFWKPILMLLVFFLTIEPFIVPNNPFHSYKFYLVVPSMPFLLLGYGMRKGIYYIINWINFWKCMLGITFFVIIALKYGSAQIWNCEYGDCYVLFFANAVVGSLFFFYLCGKIPKCISAELFSKGTLLIMAFNFVLRTFFFSLYSKIVPDSLLHEELFKPWIIASLIMIVCYYPIKWLLRFFPIILGK